METTNGTAEATVATPPTAVVAAMRNRRLPRFTWLLSVTQRFPVAETKNLVILPESKRKLKSFDGKTG
jgi:hypothetical protein